MAAGNFPRIFPLLLKHEGGYVDHPRDPGGATNMGITIGTLSDWLGRPATKAEVRALSRETAQKIYERNYWQPIGGESLPAGVDYSVVDLAVNSGVARARQFYASARRPRAEDTIRALNARRRAFLQSLRTFSTFGKGWMRRVAEVEAISLRWAMEAQHVPARVQAQSLGAEADASRARAQRAKVGGQTAAGGAVAAGGGAVSAPPEAVGHAWGWGEWALIALAVAGLAVFAAALIHRAMAESERRRALLAAQADIPEGGSA
jgi:lysozyme family protein